MGKTQAEYQKDYRARKKLTPETNALNTNAPEGPLIGWSRDTRRPTKDAVKDCLSCGGSGWSRSNRRCDCVCPVETDPEISGPLAVYSPARWAFLQSRGHTWDAARQRSTRPAKSNEAALGGVIVGVIVPGDPAYQAVSA